MDTRTRTMLSRRELDALDSIESSFVGVDYWQDETIRLYRGLGLVWSHRDRIPLKWECKPLGGTVVAYGRVSLSEGKYRHNIRNPQA